VPRRGESDPRRGKGAGQGAKKTARRRGAKERAGEDAGRGEEEARTQRSLAFPREIWAKRRPGSLAKQFAVMLLLTLIVAVAALPFVPLESGPYEKAAQRGRGAGQIGTVNLTLLPIPQLKLEKVVIGKRAPDACGPDQGRPVFTPFWRIRYRSRVSSSKTTDLPPEFPPRCCRTKAGAGRSGSSAYRPRD